MNSEPTGRIRSALRWRAGFAIAAVVIPLALYLVFERQARRLDALALYGKPVEARVTAVSRDGDTTYYSYRVNGIEYSWSVMRNEAPYATGQAFTAFYSPSDPSLSRPIDRPGLAADEAARNRKFAWKVVLGAALALALCTFMAHRDVCRIRSGAPSELSDPASYRRRIAITAVFIVLLLAAIGYFHVHDSLEQGESLWPVVIALGLSIAILAAMFIPALLGGPEKARQRSERILRWAVPVVVGIALVRLIVFILGK